MTYDIFELFQSFDYVDIETIEKMLNLSNYIRAEDFKGFSGTSLGSNSKDVLAFCLARTFIEGKVPAERLVFGMISFQQKFFQDCLIHVENISCIKGENLLPYVAQEALKVSEKILKEKQDFKSKEAIDWIKESLSNYGENELRFNIDTENSKYIYKYNEIEKRICYLGLNENLPQQGRSHDRKKI